MPKIPPNTPNETLGEIYTVITAKFNLRLCIILYNVVIQCDSYKADTVSAEIDVL